MRRIPFAATAALFFVLLSGCVQQDLAARAGHPNLIIVRDFTFSTGEVTLDPSFGFSLNRGERGVPPRQRAASVGRAAAFNVADTITQQLASLGYDVMRSDTALADPGGRALIITGAFRGINEGHRRRVGAENANVAVDVDVDLQTSGTPPQRISSMQLDSRQVPRTAVINASAQRGSSVNAAATRVGSAVARNVADTASLNRWPGAAR